MFKYFRLFEESSSKTLLKYGAMKKFFSHPSKKHNKHRGQTQSPEANKESTLLYADEDIETDAVTDLPVLLPRGAGTLLSSQLSHSLDKRTNCDVSILSATKETVNSNKQTLHANDGSPNSRWLDSGISLNSTSFSQEFLNRNIQSDLHTKLENCLKHPKHDQFIPIFSLREDHLPENFRNKSWHRLIQLKAIDVVRLTVSHTSDNRPDELGFRGVKSIRFGTGTAFLYNMEKVEQCECEVGNPGHSVSGLFRVMTASHVVFDDEEAKSTVVEFFYDSTDASTIVRGWGVRVCFVDVQRNRSVIECRTHDLNLCKQMKHTQKERDELIKKELEPEAGNAQMVVLISHPHGMCKQVSIGNLKERKIMGEVRTTKEGVQLVDCILTYDAPTCPGTGGAPVNVFGGGTANYAFAPHCASKSNGENISGLGWARVIDGHNGATSGSS